MKREVQQLMAPRKRKHVHTTAHGFHVEVISSRAFLDSVWSSSDTDVLSIVHRSRQPPTIFCSLQKEKVRTVVALAFDLL